MLQILYILAFTVIAFLAISNLIRNLINVNSDSRRLYSQQGRSRSNNPPKYTSTKVPHPELLDAQGKPVNEPLLVMRSVSVEEARQQLDQIYNSSPSHPKDQEEEI
jgi:hypothetical protein